MIRSRSLSVASTAFVVAAGLVASACAPEQGASASLSTQVRPEQERAPDTAIPRHAGIPPDTDHPQDTEPPATAPPAPLPSSTQLPSQPFENDELELVFADEFDGTALGDAWSTCYWWQIDGGCTISSNDEEQWYRSDGVDVHDGLLRLTVTDEEQRTTDGDDLPFTSGMVSMGHEDFDTSTIGFEFTYGIVEARVRFPEGDGLWPALWLLSADRTSLPEIDLFEWYSSRPDVVTSHVHQRIDGDRESERIETSFDDSLAGEWHDIAMEWTEDRVVFYFDGEETGSVDDEDLVPNTPMYLIMNVATGGPAGDVDASALPQSMAVDFVRVWQGGE